MRIAKRIDKRRLNTIVIGISLLSVRFSVSMGREEAGTAQKKLQKAARKLEKAVLRDWAEKAAAAAAAQYKKMGAESGGVCLEFCQELVDEMREWAMRVLA